MKRRGIFGILFIIVMVVVVILVSNNASEQIGNLVTIITAILGFAAVLFQLNRDHNIKKAEFLYSLNESFNNDEMIMRLYCKLKKNRVEKQYFTEDDMTNSGNYIMFFIIMNHLVNKGQVSIKMVDKIFANKFFLFCHNEDVQSAQFLTKHIKINYPIMELYETWYNYRQLNGLCILYPNFNVLAKHKNLYTVNKGLIKLRYKKNPKLKFYVNKLLKRVNDDSSFR